MSATDPLIEAIKARDLAAVRRTLDEPSGPSSRVAGRAEPPLLTAIYYRSEEIIALLLQRGAVPDLFEASAMGDLTRIRSILAEAPERLSTYSFDGWTALHLAAHYGQLEAMDFLLRTGASPHSRSTNDLGNTPLHAALAGEQRGAAEALLKSGAEADAADAHGHTPLHLAAENGDAQAIRLLLDHGADPSARSKEGRLPIDYAAQPGKEAAAELLRRAGAAG